MLPRAVLALLCATISACAPEPPPGEAGGQPLELEEVLGGDESEGFARVLEARELVFPRDHGPHPDYRSEWWYFTGNLQTDAGRRFGYELTFFRFALRPGEAARESRWATRQVYMAHLALTDVEDKRFRFYERVVRGAAGLAGARASPFRVWAEDWFVEAPETAAFPWRLRAAVENIDLDLQLTGTKPAVLQGDQGLSRKSAAPGNASYYYSIPRLRTRGSITVGGKRFSVRGQSWMDREWGTSALARDQAGWDWFALQLDDGTDLMFYRLRRKDGAIDSFSAGSLVGPQGRKQPLAHEDVDIEVLDTWASPRGGATYPSRWRLRVPTAGLALSIQPLLSDQELDASVRYWEGAVRVSGRHGEKPVRGYGYVELTGYARPVE
ncbi:MAG: carotenoid 1,2-hydratase [Gammaproteobacteria bacterium]|nr:carotenoid 1,2-hydratase [Gammaproteobacteria bacterium]NIR99115.1 carotenoid 1,2-hydratase [Gammaproteobacteria bacterium]NIT64749.1 carotenoid 1,2-hydratase [Gammaproteobacteria bacterium]NIV21710.1 carotenoid 1,2-hydratase [Gammaproteobacteria bacterium]NIV75336.1 carotenoid 1,2-hydratase [Gammaproteobacteria bacterium]